MVKARFGGYVRSRTERAQMNGVLCKALCHNICTIVHSIYELGIVPAFFRGDGGQTCRPDGTK
jgi:hypothetical protein